MFELNAVCQCRLHLAKRECYLLQVEDTSEQDMDTVVSVHNTMNEKTWQQIQMWENIDGVDPGDGTGGQCFLAYILAQALHIAVV
jgi:Cytochrome c/c1 heme lyase